MPPQLGKLLVVLGLALALLGTVIWLGGGAGLGWFGRLPGDIRIERPGFRFYAPLASMLLLSAVLWLLRQLGG